MDSIAGGWNGEEGEGGGGGMGKRETVVGYQSVGDSLPPEGALFQLLLYIQVFTVVVHNNQVKVFIMGLWVDL